MKRMFGPVWTMPIVLAVLTLVGLFGALLEDGWWDWAAAAFLAGPVVVGGWYSLRRPRRDVKPSASARRSREGGNLC